MKKTRLFMMLAAAALGLAYLGLVRSSHELFSSPRHDGAAGVIIGLFIAAHPAAGFLDMFLYEKTAKYRFSLTWPSLLWLLLDLVVLFIAWTVIYVGLVLMLGKQMQGQ